MQVSKQKYKISNLNYKLGFGVLFPSEDFKTQFLGNLYSISVYNSTGF